MSADAARGWKAVAIPSRMAKANLPRDPTHGFPVPYVAEWEHDEGTTVPPVEKRRPQDRFYFMGCNCVIGRGQPDLGAQCPIRQRRCMTKRICQVCGTKINGKFMAFLGGLSTERDDGAHYRFTEPPLHLDCAEYSGLVCPGIRKRREPRADMPGFGITICTDYRLFDKYIVGVLAPDPTAPAGLNPSAWRVIRPWPQFRPRMCRSFRVSGAIWCSPACSCCARSCQER